MNGRHAVASFALSAALTLTFAYEVRGATIEIVPGAGFGDLTPRAPEGGNPGVTLGQQRMNVFNAAAATWGAALNSTQVIKVAASFTYLACSDGGATLASAGPTSSFFIGSSWTKRLVPVALAEAMMQQEFNDTSWEVNEINASFNGRFDYVPRDAECFDGEVQWWYGLSGTAPANTIALLPTVLHELAHGLGFVTLVCTNELGCGTVAQGGYFRDGEGLPTPDRWARFLRDESFGTHWINLTDKQRVASFTNGPSVVWDGPNVNAALAGFGFTAGLSGGLVKMYAPNPFEGGSSLSHFDESALPNLLMEPEADGDVFNQLDLAVPLLADIGWSVNVVQPPPFRSGFENDESGQ